MEDVAGNLHPGNAALKEFMAEEFRTKAVEYLAGILAFLSAYGIVVVRDSHNWAKTSTFLSRYGILPHDARILATAIEYCCEKLATLDEDFTVVKDVVEIVPGNV
ncbi:PIN domain-containing protein [Thermococcus sp.]|uniref:PIN domain-containing protein n=1 Tax=Thermococcus sp. TaxID=35749 RepID=UPI00260C2D2B|nr:PIN domain-containing protein [Thermococcus sp.]